MSDEKRLRITLEGRVEALERFVDRAERVLPVLDGRWRTSLVTVRSELRGLISDAARLADQVDKVTTAFPDIARAAVEANEQLTRRLKMLATQEGLLPAEWPVQLQALIDLARKPMLMRADEEVLLEGPRPPDALGPVVMLVVLLTLWTVRSAGGLALWVAAMSAAAWLAWWRAHRSPAFRVTRERLLSVRNGPSFALRDAKWRVSGLSLVVTAGRQVLTVLGSWDGAAAMQSVLLLHDLKKIEHATPLRHHGLVEASGPGGAGMLAFGLTHVVFVSHASAPELQQALCGEREAPITAGVFAALLAMLDDADVASLPDLSLSGGVTRLPTSAMSVHHNKRAVLILAGPVTATVTNEVARRITS